MAVEGDPLTDVDLELELDGLASTQTQGTFIANALNPESIYGEPTIGQIWPR